jgi:hypothetical protein
MDIFPGNEKKYRIFSLCSEILLWNIFFLTKLFFYMLRSDTLRTTAQVVCQLGKRFLISLQCRGEWYIWYFINMKLRGAGGCTFALVR